jgi:hypothetical protein
MSVSNKHSIKIEYQTSHGTIRATWETGAEIQVSADDSPEDSFHILTKEPYWGTQLIDATAKDTHETVLLELITRFRDIQITSATHSSEFSGVLDLVLGRNDDSELLERDSCQDLNGT